MFPRPKKKYQSASSLFDRVDEKVLANISLQLSKHDFGFFMQVNTNINKTLKGRAYITDAITQIREKDVPFSCLSKALQSDPEVIEAALQYNGLNLQYLSTELKNNEEMVRIAVDQNPDASLFASDELKEALDLPTPSIARQLF
jgi:hypothetical protein